MKAAFLDWSSLNGEELDRTCLDTLPLVWQYFNKITANELECLLEQVDVVVTNKVVLDASLLERAKQLKLICIAATGTNNVDLEAAAQRKIPVCNVRGYATESVVQHVFMLMLSLSRRLGFYQQAIRDGEWQTSEYFCVLSYPIESLTGKTLGIIGYGELGRAVASMARQFGMHVLISESMADGGQHSNDQNRVKLEHLLQESDFISLHCPLTEQTHNLIDANEFGLMKNSAFIINTARGGIVNEAALLNALENKQIAGAALDVLVNEPPVDSNPLLEVNRPDLMITPHIAWGTRQARQRLLEKVAGNIQAWLQGNIINQV